MTWQDFYLICFAIGFLLSFVSFFLGGLHLGDFSHGHSFDFGGHGDASAGTHAGNGSDQVSPINLFTIAAFLAWETRVAQPMIPLGLFRSGSFSAAVAAGFLTGAAIYAAAFLTSQYFQLGLGDSPLETGLRFLPWTATPLLIAPLAGALSDRVGARVLLVPGLLMQAVGFAWIVALA